MAFKGFYKQNNMNSIPKKYYLYGGATLVILGLAGYFLFRKSEQKKAQNAEGTLTPEQKLENGIVVQVDFNSKEGSRFKSWLNNKHSRLQLVDALLLEFKKSKNNEKVMELITENLPTDEYMKVFKHTFYFHKFIDKGFFYDDTYSWDLKAWIENRLSKENAEILKSRYPSLKNHLKK